MNDAVEIGHRDGILSAASLMVSAPAASDAVARAKAMPSLRVGLHLVLVEARPTLPPQSVPDLVDAHGAFRTDMARLGSDIFFRADVRAQVAAEIEAQFAAFRDTGLALDHVNAHKHFHLHPTIAALIVEVGPRYGMRAARMPFEPRAVLRAVEPVPASASAHLLSRWAKAQRRRFQNQNILTPDSVFGLAWSGAMTAERLAGLINHLPDGLNEIYLHPATSGGFEGAAPGYRYAEELAALSASDVKDAAAHYRDIRGGFSDFAGLRYNPAS